MAEDLPHRLTVLVQYRELPSTEWVEHEPTGLVIAVCNCGLNTGWLPRDQVLAQVDRDAHTGT